MEFCECKLHEVVPEQPTAEAIVKDPVFARPFSINLDTLILDHHHEHI